MIYLDNASTTRIIPKVAETIFASMKDTYGNPSSTHSIGRKSKVAIENARNSIAKLFNCKAKEIIFTSGGTESDNSIILNAVNNIKVERIISSPIEHHAVLDTIKKIESNNNNIEIIWLKVNKKGEINTDELEKHLSDEKPTLVSLMHVNNEIGNILDINKIGTLCKKHNAIFHSDTVQGISHLSYNLSELPIDFICGSAHKFGGPKGVGFIYKKDGNSFAKQIYGGEQERDFRAGTENIYGIIGMQKALEISYSEKDKNETHLKKLKQYLISSIKNNVSGVLFNGLSEDIDKSISTIVSIKLPLNKASKMLVFQFDLKGIAISEGSACSSGNNLGSHVLKELTNEIQGGNIRISFGVENTLEEIDEFIKILKEIIEN